MVWAKITKRLFSLNWSLLLKKGVNQNEQDPNYDIKKLSLECASKRMYPDILNYDQVVKVTGSFKAPMGCRSFLGAYEENGYEVHDGRNNLGVVSLNLPRIALEAQGNEEKFYRTLDERLALAKKALLTRIARLEKYQSSCRANSLYGRRLRRSTKSR